MFGLFKKKPPAGSFVIVAVKAACILRISEIQNNWIYVPTEEIQKTVRSIAAQMNLDLRGNLDQVTQVCVMKFLMEQKFIDSLVLKATIGPVGTLTNREGDEVERILGPIVFKFLASKN